MCYFLSLRKSYSLRKIYMSQFDNCFLKFFSITLSRMHHCHVGNYRLMRQQENLHRSIHTYGHTASVDLCMLKYDLALL